MDTKAAILRCARDIYVAEGFSGLSMRAVARCAGVSATAIYRHFDHKEDLLCAVAERGHELFARSLALGLRGRDPRERLILTGMGYLDFALEQRPYYLVMFVAPPEQFDYRKLAARSNQESAVTFQMLVDRVRECIDARLLSDGDPIAHAMSIWAHVHGLVTLYYRVPDAPAAGQVPPPFASREAFARFYRSSLEALVRGLGPS